MAYLPRQSGLKCLGARLFGTAAWRFPGFRGMHGLAQIPPAAQSGFAVIEGFFFRVKRMAGSGKSSLMNYLRATAIFFWP